MTELTDAEVVKWLPEWAHVLIHGAARAVLNPVASRHAVIVSAKIHEALRQWAATRKALAESMESHRKLAVWPESCLDWPESALDEIGKMKETAGEQWLEDERLLKGEQP